MANAEAEFYRNGMLNHTTKMYDDHSDAKKLHRGPPMNLNFSAYRWGNDRQYLGFQGPAFYGKPLGNDSSNVQAVINGNAYWKRVYYRPDLEAEFARQDAQRARASSASAAGDDARAKARPGSATRKKDTP